MQIPEGKKDHDLVEEQDIPACLETGRGEGSEMRLEGQLGPGATQSGDRWGRGSVSQAQEVSGDPAGGRELESEKVGGKRGRRPA